MSDQIQSIEDLINSGSGKHDEDSTQGKFQAKQAQIKKKEVERLTNQMADEYGLPYIALSGFPVGPEALRAL